MISMTIPATIKFGRGSGVLFLIFLILFSFCFGAGGCGGSTRGIQKKVYGNSRCNA
ncbi:hypothetical protein BDZ91DRAFT_739294 [Kalaharituber pfeilii]|nr:hypothetical protein BDZ91DRAFT_739294 [Kalaharituber pfeilii]